MTIFEEVGQFRPVLTIFGKGWPTDQYAFDPLSLWQLWSLKTNVFLNNQQKYIFRPTMLNEEIFTNYLNFFLKIHFFFYQKIPSTALYNTLYDARLLYRRFKQISTYTIFRTYLFLSNCLGSGSKGQNINQKLQKNFLTF